MRRFLVLVLLACLLPFGRAAAQETIFYKCTDAKGQVTIQNAVPCGPGMKQEIRRVQSTPTVPVPTRPAADSAPAEERPQPRIGDFILAAGPNMARRAAPEAASLPPPPALYQCTTWDGDTYFGETATPEPRCAPLQVVGLDGRPTPGAAQACEMRQDTCAATPDDQLCTAWYRRLDEADFKLRYARSGERAQHQAERDAIDAKIRASRCSPVAPDPASQDPAPVP